MTLVFNNFVYIVPLFPSLIPIDHLLDQFVDLALAVVIDTNYQIRVSK